MRSAVISSIVCPNLMSVGLSLSRLCGEAREEYLRFCSEVRVVGAELGDRHSLEGAKARSGPYGSQAKLKIMQLGQFDMCDTLASFYASAGSRSSNRDPRQGPGINEPIDVISCLQRCEPKMSSHGHMICLVPLSISYGGSSRDLMPFYQRHLLDLVDHRKNANRVSGLISSWEISG